MGQRFVPELHEPKSRNSEGQDDAALTEREVRIRFDALIDMIDAEELRAKQRI